LNNNEREKLVNRVTRFKEGLGFIHCGGVKIKKVEFTRFLSPLIKMFKIATIYVKRAKTKQDRERALHPVC
jgi:hypothetical protein